MYKRYENTRKLNNASDKYKEIFSRKKVNYMKHYGTFRLNKIDNSILQQYEFYLHTYIFGEKLYNISNSYYDSPEFSWVILYTNNLSSEFLLNEGDVLYIYYPIFDIINLISL